MPSKAFGAVASEGRGRRGYSDDLHQRIDNLVQEWLQIPEGGNIPFAVSANAFSAEVQDCDDWVRQEYLARYGEDHRGPFGCVVPGFILMALIGGIISWLVQRTLDRMFPRSTGSAD